MQSKEINLIYFCITVIYGVVSNAIEEPEIN